MQTRALRRRDLIKIPDLHVLHTTVVLINHSDCWSHIIRSLSCVTTHEKLNWVIRQPQQLPTTISPKHSIDATNNFPADRVQRDNIPHDYKLVGCGVLIAVEIDWLSVCPILDACYFNQYFFTAAPHWRSSIAYPKTYFQTTGRTVRRRNSRSRVIQNNNFAKQQGHPDEFWVKEPCHSKEKSQWVLPLP